MREMINKVFDQIEVWFLRGLRAIFKGESE